MPWSGDDMHRSGGVQHSMSRTIGTSPKSYRVINAIRATTKVVLAVQLPEYGQVGEDEVAHRRHSSSRALSMSRSGVDSGASP
jgi:hypothetical protein